MITTGERLQTHRYAIASTIVDPIARRSDIVVAQRWNADRIAKAKELGATVLVYQNLTRAKAPGTDGLYSTALTEEEARKIGALTNNWDKDAGWICLPGSFAYAYQVAEAAIEAAIEANADGVFLDDMNANGPSDDWHRELDFCNAIVGAKLAEHGLISVANMCGTIGEWNLKTEGWVERQFDHFDGGFDEFFVTWPGAQIQPTTYINEALRVMRRQTQRGKFYLATCNGPAAVTDYALALALLNGRGPLRYFATRQGGYGEEAYSRALSDAKKLGRPTSQPGLSRREFEHGEVIVRRTMRTFEIRRFD